MTTQKYTISAYDCNGKQASKTIYARSMRGAKTQATNFASGTTHTLYVDGPDGMFKREAELGSSFCYGMSAWKKV